VPVGSGANGLAVSVATNSVYVANSGAPSLGHTVSVINGATCNGSVHLGCATPVATAEVGLEPFDVAVDDATHTVYVVDNANGDSPGNVTVIDSATCNGSSTVGCAGHHPRAGIGRSGLLAAIDTVTHLVYVSDYSSAAVSVIDGKACAATKTGGCTREAPLRAVPSNPFGIAVDHGVHTVYVATFSGALAMLRTA
jgi:DNA-binding beta-propeller fold protein YncE